LLLGACPPGTGLYRAARDGTRRAVSAHPGRDPFSNSSPAVKRKPQSRTSGRLSCSRRCSDPRAASHLCGPIPRLDVLADGTTKVALPGPSTSNAAFS
jgi:hypothetical protein